MMITIAMTCMPLKSNLVCMGPDGKLKGPPNERMRAVRETDRNMVAGFWAKRRRDPKNTLASKPAIRMAVIAVNIFRGLVWEPIPSSGIRYCSPSVFVSM